MANLRDKPICFIAMAFDHEDTDYLYENQILPVLKSNGIKPIIINRQQSNDDLNIQIIEQLQDADFCITDLTYARQSVYFEAGFAQRTIPVIYTVRKDHLKSGQPDHLRVHFDLQMKPLIVWSSPYDSTFASRLEQRIKKTFLNTWKRNQTVLSKYKEAIEEFNGLPLNERLIIMRREAIGTLRKLGVLASDWSDGGFFANQYGRFNKSLILKGEVNHINAIHLGNRVAQYVSVHSYQSLTKNELGNLYNRYSWYAVTNEVARKTQQRKKQRVETLFQDVLFLTLKPISTHQVASVLDSFTLAENPLRFNGEFAANPYPYNGFDVMVKVSFCFLDGITSQVKLKEQLENLKQQIQQRFETR